MFTGIVAEIGAVVSRSKRGPGARLAVSCSFRDLQLGESIAVSGVCLTVDKVISGGRRIGGDAGRTFEADASAETLQRSTLVEARAGRKVNLERALRMGDRLGGHLVGGHVDATTRVVERKPLGEAMQLRFALPPRLAPFIAAKGSITVDGVSLTVNEVATGSFDLVVVPHTLGATTLGGLAVNGTVNLEVDVLARYVARFLDQRRSGGDDQRHTAAHPTNEESPDHENPALVRALRGAGYF